MIKEAIKSLVAGESLEFEQAAEVMEEIMGGEATPAQIHSTQPKTAAKATFFITGKPPITKATQSPSSRQDRCELPRGRPGCDRRRRSSATRAARVL